MVLYKNHNGSRVVCTPEEEAEVRDYWKKSESEASAILAEETKKKADQESTLDKLATSLSLTVDEKESIRRSLIK